MLTDAESILAAWSDDVRSFVAGMGVALDAVDDVAQEAFLTYLREPGKRPEGVEEIRWLKGIARNLAYDWFRRRSGPAGRLRLAELLADIPAPEMAAAPERLGALRRCLEGLDANTRSLLNAAYHEDESSEHIAQRLGRSPSGIRMALLRVRERLRLCVDQRLAHEGGT